MRLVFFYILLMMAPTILATSCEQCYMEIEKIKNDLTSEIQTFIEYSSKNPKVLEAEDYVNHVPYTAGIIEGLNWAQMKISKTHKKLD